MITVNGSESDYAIMKQVQQLRRAYPQMAVVTLDANTNFSALAADETLYLVSHGNIQTGDFRDAEIPRDDLLGWLAKVDPGVPNKFGGIVILSCYSGLATDQAKGSLAAHLAKGLAGRVAVDTPVEGANGFSFGTPEFRKSGRSSVQTMDLYPFYLASYIDPMAEGWLQRKPTHTDGILKDKFGIHVNTAMTIGDQLATVQQSSKKTPEQISVEEVTAFAKEAKEIEGKLEEIIENNIQGNSVAARAEFLVAKANEANQHVVDWNKAIDRQFELFNYLYLWTPPAAAFSVEKVPKHT